MSKSLQLNPNSEVTELNEGTQLFAVWDWLRHQDPDMLYNNQEIAKGSGVNKKSVGPVMTLLYDSGWVEREKVGRGFNYYANATKQPFNRHNRLKKYTYEAGSRTRNVKVKDVTPTVAAPLRKRFENLITDLTDEITLVTAERDALKEEVEVYKNLADDLRAKFAEVQLVVNSF